jgi:hypothetical protein
MCLIPGCTITSAYNPNPARNAARTKTSPGRPLHWRQKDRHETLVQKIAALASVVDAAKSGSKLGFAQSEQNEAQPNGPGLIE